LTVEYEGSYSAATASVTEEKSPPFNLNYLFLDQVEGSFSGLSTTLPDRFLNLVKRIGENNEKVNCELEDSTLTPFFRRVGTFALNLAIHFKVRVY